MMLGQSTFVGFGMMDENLEPCPYQIQTSLGTFKKANGFIKIDIFVKLNAKHPISRLGPSHGDKC
jgi:hypothetical protein